MQSNPSIFRRYVGGYDRPCTALTGAYCYRHAPNSWWLAYDAIRIECKHQWQIVDKEWSEDDTITVVWGCACGAFKTTEEDKANARLIAAAPDLLEALKALADWPRQSERYDGKLTTNAAEGLANVRRYARAAIEAAKGDS